MKYMNPHRDKLTPRTQEETEQIIIKFVTQRLKGELDIHGKLYEATKSISQLLLDGELMETKYNVVYTQDRRIYSYLSVAPGSHTYQPILDVITFLEHKNPALGYEKDFLKRVRAYDKEFYAIIERHPSGTGLLKRRLAELRPLIIDFLHELQAYIRELEEELTGLIGPRVFQSQS
jgi:hypothetical protein